MVSQWRRAKAGKSPTSIPSTPAAPPLAFTRFQAPARLAGDNTCSNRSSRTLSVSARFASMSHFTLRLRRGGTDPRVGVPSLVRPFVGLRPPATLTCFSHSGSFLRLLWPLLTPRRSRRALPHAALEPGGLPPVDEVSPHKSGNLRHPSAPFTSGTETRGFAVLCQLT